LEYILLPEAEVSKHGLLSTATQMLQNGDVDISSYIYSRSFELSQVMEISYPLMVQDYVLLLRQPTEEGRMFLFYKPFSDMVWLALALSVAAQAVFRRILSGSKRKIGKPVTNLKELEDEASGISDKASRYHSKILLYGTWVLMAAVLFYSYTQILTSYLTVPTLKPLPNSLEDLSKDPHVQLISEWNFVKTKTILRATSGPLKLLGDELREHPHLMTKTPGESIKRVLTEGNAYLGSVGIIHYFMGMDLKQQNGKCRFTTSSKLADFNPVYGFGLPLNGPHNTRINKKLEQIFESNIVIEHLYNKYVAKVNKCMMKEINKENRRKLRQLEFKDLAGFFVILGIGACLALFVFLLENIFWLKQERQKRKTANQQTMSVQIL